MEWLEVSLIVDPELAEAVADVLSRYAPGGVAYEQNAVDLPGEAGAGWRPDGPLEPQVTVRAYLPVGSEVDAKRGQIEQALWHLGQIQPLPAASFRPVAEQEWADAWKDHFHVTRIGQRFVIKPSWRAYEPQPGDVVIELDPGQAFGTGLHPTTQICLTALEEHLQPGGSVLDLGTGSGILAIAAARLGASHVLALDVDPVAVEAAQANVEANQVGQVVTVAQGSIATLCGESQTPALAPKRSAGASVASFKFVLVNILAQVIVELFEQGLGQAVAPGGLLVLAGLIDTQEDAVRAALSRAGLELVRRLQHKDWVGLIGRQRGQALTADLQCQGVLQASLDGGYGCSG